MMKCIFNNLFKKMQSILKNKSLDNDGERVEINFCNKINYEKLDIYQKSHYQRYRYAKSIIQADKIVGDFACGTGYGSVILSEISKEVVGIDIDRAVISAIKKRYAYYTNIQFMNKNLLDLDFHNYFDYIISFETIEHFKEDDISRLFELYYKSLKNDGKIIFSVPYKQEKSPEAIQMGFHHTFEIDEEKISKWLNTKFLIERIRYQNYSTHAIENHLVKKDFIIYMARKI